MKKFKDYYEAVNEANKTWGDRNGERVYRDCEEDIYLVISREEAKTICNDKDRFYLVY